MPSLSRLSQITKEIEQAIADAPDVESAISDLLSRAPTDHNERHHFDSVIAIARVSSTKATKHTLVFVIHGIRDEGPWMEMIREVIGSSSVTVQPIDFDDFDALRFLLGCKVNAIIEMAAQKMRHAISHLRNKHRDLRLMAIGHSFGTYVLLKVLDNHPDIELERMIFCGSVAPRKFRYDKLKNAPQMVNDCGARDIWPIVAESFGWKDYGAAGVWGIRVANVHDRYHDCGHSDYLEKDFAEEFWKPFIVSGAIPGSVYETARRPAPRGLRLLGYGYWLVGGLIFLALSPCLYHLVLQENYVTVRWFAAVATWGLTGLLFAWITHGTVRFMYPKFPSETGQSKQSSHLRWVIALLGLVVIVVIALWWVGIFADPKDQSFMRIGGP
jgi:hypothetical protein